MKHELGENYTWRQTPSSESVLCKIELIIPAMVDPRINPEKCSWIDSKNKGDYFWGCLEHRLFDTETYCVAVDPVTYFKNFGSAVAENMSRVQKPVLIRVFDFPAKAEVKVDAKAETIPNDDLRVKRSKRPRVSRKVDNA